ncbi:uncharacterized protein LOC129611145 [Condylostylus longicornis]|uniref:uncharacterized protein LOC129611145 n=1 Tax=Condylostylus longicornis TaxID=2530218 RepID=UPI00244E1429|nr:uncharacterized protein LOC129611145 [Condylostylus longicornis]
MSSIPEKSNLLREKRSFFLRSGSFEKLKCSAKYPFRVVGVKLSKASVVELAESIIARSRLLSQRLLLILFIILYKAICATLSILVRTSANPLSVVAVCDKQNKNTTLGFYERLQIKVEKLQKHKKRLDSLKSSDEIYGHIIRENVQILKIQQTTPITPIITSNLPSTPIATPVSKNLNNFNDSIINNNNNNNNVKDDEFHAEIKRLRKLYGEKECSSNIFGKIQQFSEINFNRNLLETIFLYPLVYGSILIMLCQIYVLGCVLNSTTITLGYIFLIGSLGIVAIITFKVFFSYKLQKDKTTSNNKKFNQSNEQTTNQNNNDVNLIATSNTATTTEAKRQSRSRLKKDIDLSSKTLSKIKLL